MNISIMCQMISIIRQMHDKPAKFLCIFSGIIIFKVMATQVTIFGKIMMFFKSCWYFEHFLKNGKIIEFCRLLDRYVSQV